MLCCNIYSVIQSLLDTYLPYVAFINYSTDKPCITENFRQLIRSRQLAFHRGDMTRFRMLIIERSLALG